LKVAVCLLTRSNSDTYAHQIPLQYLIFSMALSVKLSD